VNRAGLCTGAIEQRCRYFVIGTIHGVGYRIDSQFLRRRNGVELCRAPRCRLRSRLRDHAVVIGIPLKQTSEACRYLLIFKTGDRLLRCLAAEVGRQSVFEEHLGSSSIGIDVSVDLRRVCANVGGATRIGNYS
jgi:hypothetical protein